MARPMTVTFLGTCSGGGPNESRNCLSLIVDCLRDGSLWMFAFQPADAPVRLKPQSVSKLFITHNARRPHHGMTLTQTAERYVAHELLRPEDTPTPCEPSEVMHSKRARRQRHPLFSRRLLEKLYAGNRGPSGPLLSMLGLYYNRDPCLGYIIREPATPARKLRMTHPLSSRYRRYAHIPCQISPRNKRNAGVCSTLYPQYGRRVARTI
ncbi:hypothetical protein B0H14DRAFT_2687430, partial [Mycena olivaceomarginata]